MSQHKPGALAKPKAGEAGATTASASCDCIWRRWTTWAAVGAVVAAVCVLEMNDDATLQGARHVAWGEEELVDIVAERRPVVITGSGVGSWPSANWTAESIASEVEWLRGVRENDVPVFQYFNRDKPMADLPGAQNAPLFRERDMRAEAFFEALQGGGPPFHYFSADLDSLPRLRQQVPESGLSDFKAGREGLLLNLWLGGKGVIAETHIDTSHNFYVQIRGVKRFILLPPTRGTQLGVYPFLHPAYRRARTALRKPGQELRLELLAHLGAVQVDLEPGQVLYLPPYWFHNVEALDDSISLNIWTDSEEYKASEAMFLSPVPVEEDWPPQRLTRAINTYVDLILGQLSAPARANTVAGLHARFRDLPGAIPAGSAAPDCARNASEDLARGIISLEPHLSALPEGVQELYAGNLVEVLLHYAVGVETVAAHILQCF